MVQTETIKQQSNNNNNLRVGHNRPFVMGDDDDERAAQSVDDYEDVSDLGLSLEGSFGR